MNPFMPVKGKVLEDKTINDKKFLRVERNFSFIPGQFVEISIAGVGEFPISICSPPYEKNFFEVCIRKVGRATSFLYNNKIDYLLYRGPFGNGFPMEKLEGKNIVVIIGGLGILPLRSFIKEAIHSKIYNQMKILYGARSRDDLLFAEEIEEWKNYAEVYKIFEEEGMKRGFVTELIDEIVFDGKEYEMFLTISEYEGKEYYQILGFENGGAGFNFSPRAKLSKDYFKGEINKEIVFDASLSFDQNDDPLEFFFDFGDGNSTTTKNPIISHSYKKEGQYDLKLIVSDGMEEDTILAKVDILPSFPSFFSGGSSNRSFLTSPSPTPFNQSPSVPFLLDFEKKEKYLKEEKKEEEILQNEDFFLESKESIVNETSKPPETQEISFLKENQREVKNFNFAFLEKLPFAGFFSFSFSKIIFIFFIFALIFVIILKSRKTK